MTKQPDFENNFSAAVDLHRSGKTVEALSAVEQLLAASTDEEQRQSCIAEMENLRLRLEWQVVSKTA